MNRIKKYKVSVVIITEKNVLTRNEEISFKRALEVFPAYNKYLVIPESTNESAFDAPAAVNVIKLPDHHFRDVNAYSRLLLSSFFYELFAESEHILIYQLDCFVFHDNLDEFLNFDYVGAPWFHSQNNAGNAIIRTLLLRKPLVSLRLLLGYYLKHRISAVGNGGFSLRRVDKFIEIIKDKRISKIISSWIKCKRPHEDIFYSFIAPRFVGDFRIADIKSALKFSFETYPGRCYADNNYELPVGCHAWPKHDIEFWRKIFRKFNYTIVLFFIFFTPWVISAQSLPVGTPVLEDYYRRQQLLGKVDSTVSFTVRPVFPVKIQKGSVTFDLKGYAQIKNEKSVLQTHIPAAVVCLKVPVLHTIRR